jgi:hypothetical protein
MRTLNQMLLIMAAAGLVGWFYARMLITALVNQASLILRSF